MQENEFFFHLYKEINEIITPQGQIYKHFTELIEKNLPNNLSDYCDYEQMQSIKMQIQQNEDQLNNGQTEAKLLEHIQMMNMQNLNLENQLDMENIYGQSQGLDINQLQ